MPGPPDPSYALPAQPWACPPQWLCTVDNHLVYCDPHNVLRYVCLEDRSSYVLDCGPHAQPSVRTADAACQPLPLEVRALVPHPVTRRLVVLGERAVAVVEVPPFELVRAGRGNGCFVQRLALPYFAASSTLQLVAARWHPLSDRHVVTLTSDQQLRLFNTALDPDEPEQAVRLWTMDDEPSGAPDSPILWDRSPAARVVGFDFLRGSGWHPFMVVYGTAAGDLYTVGPLVPFGSLLPAELFDDLPLPESCGPGDPSHHASAARRDAWRKDVVQQNPDNLPPALGARVCLTATTSSSLAAQYVAAIGPINAGDDMMEECASVEVLPVDPPVVALGCSGPEVKLFALTRELVPPWLLEDPEGGTFDSQFLHRFDVVSLHTDAAPDRSSAPAGATTLHSDPIRPDRLLCAHPAEGLFVLHLPPFFLPTSQDRPLALQGPTVLAVQVAAGGPWPTLLGAAFVPPPPAAAQPSSVGRLYTLSAQPISSGPDFRVVLQALDLDPRPLTSKVPNLLAAPTEPTIAVPGDSASSKAAALLMALQRFDAEGYVPSLGRPLRATPAQEEQWAALFQQMVKDFQHARVETLTTLMKEVDHVNEETKQLRAEVSAQVPDLQRAVQRLPPRQEGLERRLEAVVQRQRELLGRNQAAVEAVLRRTSGGASEQQRQFQAQLQRVRTQFLPNASATLSDLEAAATAAPAPAALPPLSGLHLADVERVARGTMELIVASQKLATSCGGAAPATP